MAVSSLNRSVVQKRRIKIAFLFILACYVGLMARLLYLQVLHGAEIHQIAAQGRERRIVLPARKGTIVDRNGRPLAASLYIGEAGFDPFDTLTTGKDAKTARKIETDLASSIQRAALLLQIPEAELTATVQKARADFNPHKPHHQFVRLKKGLSMDTALLIKDARPPLLGFGILDGSKRVYASGDSAAHVVGFVRSDGVAQAGLERGCRKWLDGASGFALAEVDDHKREIPDTIQKMVPSRDGYDVHTTLDANIQHIVTEEAEKIVADSHPRGVSVIALDPNTGDILALASLPTFDPNPGKRKELNALPKVEMDEHFRDRCVSSLYEPGSTLKALTIAAALDQGIITPTTSFYCPGSLTVSKKTIREAHSEVHGEETVRDVLRHSCNVASAQIGMRMTAKKLKQADEQFGLMDKLNLGVPGGIAGKWSCDPNEKQYSEAKAARVAFGHSIVTTPLHVALAYAAFANGGLLMKPRLITSLTDGTGKTVQKWEPQTVRRVVSPATSALMTDMLRSVVSSGTAKTIAMPGYQFAGKTGTAQKYTPGKYVASFIGYLPASPHVKPRVVILVAVDEPTGEKHFGAEVAAPAFKAIATRLMQYWRVPEDDPNCVQSKAAEYTIKHPEKLAIHHN